MAHPGARYTHRFLGWHDPSPLGHADQIIVYVFIYCLLLNGCVYIVGRTVDIFHFTKR